MSNSMIRVCGGIGYPPFEFFNENGEFVGFNVDMIRAIAHEAMVPIRFDPMPWEDAIAALRGGLYDAVQGMVSTPERGHLFAFSDDYLVVSHAIFVSRERRHIVSLRDLSGLTVAMQKGDASYEIATNNSDGGKVGFHSVFTIDQAEAFSRLVSGEVDAYIGNRMTGMYLAQSHNLLPKIRIVGQPISPKSYCVATLKGRESLVSLLNQSIRAIKSNGVYESICEKWFGVSPGRLATHMVESVDAGVIAVNTLGIIESVNPYAVHTLGLHVHSCIGRHLIETDLSRYFDPDLLDECAASGKGVFDRELSIDTSRGSLILGYSVVPIGGDTEATIGCIISFRDITQEKLMRARLMQKDKMESLGLLLANIAHEIRNPIAAIKNFAEALPGNYDDPAFRAQASRYIPQEIGRVESLVRQILSYARPRSPDRRLCRLSQVVDDSVALVAARIGGGQSVSVDVPDQIAVLADDTHLRQILVNILLNALDAVGEQGRICIVARQNHGKTVVEVTDDGPGISGRDIDKVFDPFFTTKDEGTGLGLFIAYQLVKENGGEINLLSQSGHGTTARIEFPEG